MHPSNAELEEIYTRKMKEWPDSRLVFEFTLAKNAALATPETMEIWNRCLGAEANRRGIRADYVDGEVLRIDSDGHLIMWDVESQTPFDSGETLEGYGIHNLSVQEKARLRIDLPPES